MTLAAIPASLAHLALPPLMHYESVRVAEFNAASTDLVYPVTVMLEFPLPPLKDSVARIW